MYVKLNWLFLSTKEKKNRQLSQSVSSCSLKYSGIKIDEIFTWKHYLYEIALYSNREDVCFYEIRDYSNFKVFKVFVMLILGQI